MGIPIPHTLVQTSKISVGFLSKIVAALYIPMALSSEIFIDETLKNP